MKQVWKNILTALCLITALVSIPPRMEARSSKVRCYSDKSGKKRCYREKRGGVQFGFGVGYPAPYYYPYSYPYYGPYGYGWGGPYGYPYYGGPGFGVTFGF